MRKNFLPDNFSPETAMRCLQLINVAYDRFTQFKTAGMQPIALPDGCTVIEELWAKPEGLFSHIEPFGFIVMHTETNTIYVVFRGTESHEDWFSNMAVAQVPYEIEGYVHQGFYDIYNQFGLHNRDLNLLANPLVNREHVVITGHSLGAALATFALDDAPASRTSLYTFASPRVGDSLFAEEFSNRLSLTGEDATGCIFRIFNTEDIVPTAPLPVIDESSYTHIGTPIAFTDNKGDIVKNHSSAEGGTYWRFIKSLIE